MDANTFVTSLRAIAPTKDQLKRFDITEEFANNFIKRYDCITKSSKDITFTSDVLLLLLQKYDCSNVEIAIVSLLPEAIEEMDYYQIGYAEQDTLVINKISLEVEVRDHDALHHVIWRCALNSSHFLESLLYCAACLTERLKNSFAEESPSVVSNHIEVCTAKAGGSDYMEFYKMLLG
jgi:hypothetical protein